MLVTTTASKAALLILEMAGPEKMPWVRMAYTLVAPAESSLENKAGERCSMYESPGHILPWCKLKGKKEWAGKLLYVVDT